MKKSGVGSSTYFMSFAPFVSVALSIALTMLAMHVYALCPTNGNTHAIYMTSNMGDNIWSFDTQGNYIGDVIDFNTFPDDVKVHKLRAMRYGPGGHLYVLSASGSYSRVFAISGDGVVNKTLEPECKRKYLFTVIKQDKVSTILDHPYDMVFHPVTHDLFVANQNSITVTKYKYTGMVPVSSASNLELSSASLLHSNTSKHTKFPRWKPIANNPHALPPSNTDALIDTDDDETFVFMGNSSRQNNSTEELLVPVDSHAFNAAKHDKTENKKHNNEVNGEDNDDDDNDNTLNTDREIDSDSSNTIDIPKIADNAGLFISSWSNEYFLGSVRGIALSPLLPRALVDGSAPPGLFSIDNSSLAHYLLVCDVATNAVRVFDPDTGNFIFSIYVPSPIQVMFPSRYYKHGETTVSASGAIARNFETPYIYVTSKEDGMAYLVRFSSHTPPPSPSSSSSSSLSLMHKTRVGGLIGTRNVDIAIDGDNNYNNGPGAYGANNEHTTRLYAITNRVPLHGASGLYEYPERDVLLIADRNGRKVSSYASPFLSDYTSSYGPTPFLGYFLKQLPDQPEFLMSTLLESQANIPFCYELNADGSFHYVALCTAAYIWSFILLAVLIVVPSLLIYRQVQHWRRVQRRQARLRKKNEDVFQPLLGENKQTEAKKYGTYV